jgi:U3 small nucleolar RNA-associated protein 19
MCQKSLQITVIDTMLWSPIRATYLTLIMSDAADRRVVTSIPFGLSSFHTFLVIKFCGYLTMPAANPSPAELSKQIKALSIEVADVRADAVRLDELRRLYARLTGDGELTFGTKAPENNVAAKWRAFLMKHHKMMVSQLRERVEMGRHSAIRCLFGVVAASPCMQPDGNGKEFPCVNFDLLQKWLSSMTLQEADEMDRAMRHMVESEFLHPYRDVQYYALGAITLQAKAEYDRQKVTSSTKIAEKLLEFLMIIPIPKSEEDMGSSQYLCPPPSDAVPPSHDDDSSDEEHDDEESSEEEEDNDRGRPNKRRKTTVHKFPFQRHKSFLGEYQKAWMAVLKLNLPLSALKRTLSFLPHYVLDYVPSPLRFADFFMQAYSDHGSGLVGVLALDGLFELITENGLEYPDFYKQLYRLVSSRVLYAKHRSRFFSLLTKCLIRNEMLPAHLVAAFCKRLCRAALSGPPPGALFVLALVSNLLRKHPECTCLYDRKSSDDMTDEYLAQEDDPTKARALQSSLWELSVLERHYYAPVATLAKSIGTPEEARAPPHKIDDFSNQSYKSLFDQERKNRSKKTALTFKEPESLFRQNDVFSEALAF